MILYYTKKCLAIKDMAKKLHNILNQISVGIVLIVEDQMRAILDNKASI
jgi:hypothetical protein